MKRRLLVMTAVVAMLGVAGLGVRTVAAGGGDDDQPLTGATLQQASAAALAHTGGGQVVETEVGDDGAAYDIEVRLPDGSTVEVRLDAAFKVIGQEADDDGPNDTDDADDD